MVWSESVASVVDVTGIDGPGSALLSVAISDMACVTRAAEFETEHLLSVSCSTVWLLMYGRSTLAFPHENT